MGCGTSVVFVGPAASGKTSLVKSYGDWLESMGYSVIRVNLDPAAKALPYNALVNVRDVVRSEELEVREGLGPNGALIKSLEEVSVRLNELLKPLSEGFDYALIDTPGQMEVFLTRDVSIKLSEALSKLCRFQLALFVIDSTLVRRVEDYAFVLMLGIATQLRMGMPAAPVLSKVDLIDSGVLDSIAGDLISEYEALTSELNSRASTYAEMLSEVINVVSRYAKAASVPKVSSLTGEGMQDLHRLVMEFTCSCGDLT